MIFCRLVSEGRDQNYDESVREELLSDRKPESQGKEVDIIGRLFIALNSTA